MIVGRQTDWSACYDFHAQDFGSHNGELRAYDGGCCGQKAGVTDDDGASGQVAQDQEKIVIPWISCSPLFVPRERSRQPDAICFPYS